MLRLFLPPLSFFVTSGSQLFGALYTGTVAGSGTWLNLQVPDGVAGGTVYDTSPYSVMGDLVVGNFNIVGSNASRGSGFIDNIVSSNYSTLNLPGGRITSLCGVWQNGTGSSSYTLIGGTAETLGLTKALIVNYDAVSANFSDPTEYVITNGADVSHLEGITGADGGFNVVGVTGVVTNGLSTGECSVSSPQTAPGLPRMSNGLHCFIPAVIRPRPIQSTATTPWVSSSLPGREASNPKWRLFPSLLPWHSSCLVSAGSASRCASGPDRSPRRREEPGFTRPPPCG